MADDQFVLRFNKMLAQHQYTLVCAESITAGLLASTIASAPGTSKVLKGSIVTYDAAMKEQLLGVPRSILERYSPESQETTDAMLRGLKAVFPNAIIHVAVTGIASHPPAGYIPSNPVGQVYVALSIDGDTYTFDPIVRPEIQDEWGNETRRATVYFILERILERVTNAPYGQRSQTRQA